MLGAADVDSSGGISIGVGPRVEDVCRLDASEVELVDGVKDEDASKCSCEVGLSIIFPVCGCLLFDEGEEGVDKYGVMLDTLDDGSTMGTLNDGSMLGTVDNVSMLDTLDDGSTLGTLDDGSMLDTLYNGSTLGTIDDGSMLDTLYNGSTLGTIDDGSMLGT